MSKRIYTTYVDVMLRCGTTTSGPVGGFEFDHTEDAIIFGSDLVRRLDSVLMDHDEVIGVHYDHTMRDYVNIYIDIVHSDYGFERVWPIVCNVCRVCQTFDKMATGSSVVEFPYGY